MTNSTPGMRDWHKALLVVISVTSTEQRAHGAVREGYRAGDRRASWAISERRDGPRFRLHWWLSILAELVRLVPDGLLTGGR